jgi:hypothetical protein
MAPTLRLWAAGLLLAGVALASVAADAGSGRGDAVLSGNATFGKVESLSLDELDMYLEVP